MTLTFLQQGQIRFMKLRTCKPYTRAGDINSPKSLVNSKGGNCLKSIAIKSGALHNFSDMISVFQ